MMPWSGVFDAHVDTLLVIGSASSFIDGNAETHVDLPRARVSGVSGMVVAICAEACQDPREALSRGLEQWAEIKAASEGMDLRLGLEGCEPLAAGWIPRDAVDAFSVATLTWNGMNSLGGGTGTDEGLTAVGRRIVHQLHDTGVVIDVSHLCDRARRDVISMGLPVSATHSNCRSLCDAPRNLPDDDIREIAALGGVVGITFVPDFTGPDASLDMVLDHLEHAASVAGVAHVGFGSDFDGVKHLPEGITDVTAWPSVFEALERRGWRTTEMELVAGGNWRRVFDGGGTGR